MPSPDMNMVVDVVDLRNRPVGLAKRHDVLPNHQNFRTVHALLYAPHQDALVLQLLPATHLRSPLRMGSSVAGYLHAGEDYRAAIRRKLADELHIDNQLELIDLGEVTMVDGGSTKFIGLYVGELQAMPSFDEDQIAGLVVLPIATLDHYVDDQPSLFTRTFLDVYKQFRNRREGRGTP